MCLCFIGTCLARDKATKKGLMSSTDSTCRLVKLFLFAIPKFYSKLGTITIIMLNIKSEKYKRNQINIQVFSN